MLCCLLLLLVFATPAFGESKLDLTKLPPVAKSTIDFDRDIQPLFAKACLKCHDAEKHRGGLRLDNATSAMEGGDTGKVIVVGKSDQSRLIHLVAGLDADFPMPPTGTKLTRDEISLLRAWIDQGAKWGKMTDVNPIKITSKHWSFQPRMKPPLPVVKQREFVRNGIDAFILSRLEKENVTPSPEADRITLIRRLTLDLIGLLPTPTEIDAFVNDTSPEAYDKVVDRLLASPHYGERWGRHWLDAAHYADSDGYEKDTGRPFAFRYRDWVINALNRDLKFDQFTIQQLAGDLLPNSTIEQRVATGFHRNTLTNKEGGVDKEQFRVEQVIDRVNTTARVFMGVTMGCAQCHDHKYDPFSQREYYQMFAFFDSDIEVDLALDATNKAQTLAIGKPKKTHVMIRGDFLRPGVEVKPNLPAVLPTLESKSSSRLDLAKWLVHPDHPLTSRVVVNWVWQKYFGRGLVGTLEDFGTQGELPTHPELLDWLANQFIEQGYSMKELHRTIVMSATYRQSSRNRPELKDRDPSNLWLARQNRQRLEAEIIRDVALHASGLLEPRIGGPSIRPPQPSGISELTYANSARWVESQGSDRFRRGLYIWFQRTSPFPMLMTFDEPDSNLCTVRRERSNTPLQALTLMNDVVFIECAQSLGRRILIDLPNGSSTERLIYAFRLCLGRSPSPPEMERLTKLLSEFQALAGKDNALATRLIGSRRIEKIPIAEQAAWVAMGRTLMNLDEFMTRE